ncbi:MAG: hypothetical protein KatS3mg105_3193 [Gemmatales bacterium]|nr:MAG: hypothetical protein KatS3mg105_3149 [Gemmatales bacterium]GIW81386.1 MAG: hypothetical protein KatS3mg105_3193 [Gemmatales bacterium]
MRAVVTGLQRRTILFQTASVGRTNQLSLLPPFRIPNTVRPAVPSPPYCERRSSRVRPSKAAVASQSPLTQREETPSVATTCAIYVVGLKSRPRRQRQRRDNGCSATDHS